MTPDDTHPLSPDEAPRPPGAPPVKVMRSEDIFQGQRMVYIEHAGALYRLMITSRGKLILQK